MRKTMVVTGALVGLGALSAVGCSADAKPTPTVTVTVTRTVTASPAAPVAPADLGIGATAPITQGTVTLHALNPDSAPEPAPQPESPNDKWASADVELCNTGAQAFPFSTLPWTLIDTANHAFTPSSIGYNQFPEPSYAWGDETLNAGECRRGWITFVVNKDAQLSAVRYQNSSGQLVRWAL